VSARFEALGVIVSDMARALAFYRRLGLEFPEGAESEGHVEAQLPGGLRFMLDTEETIRSFEPEWQRPNGSSIGLAFACDSPAEVDRLYGELTAAGSEGMKEPWDAFWGQRYAIVRDPDGTPIDLFASLE
jgi:catechol 2,3-dioxygenase-like lactoylglutathione lyase family enzyme